MAGVGWSDELVAQLLFDGRRALVRPARVAGKRPAEVPPRPHLFSREPDQAEISVPGGARLAGVEPDPGVDIAGRERHAAVVQRVVSAFAGIDAQVVAMFAFGRQHDIGSAGGVDGEPEVAERLGEDPGIHMLG